MNNTDSGSTTTVMPKRNVVIGFLYWVLVIFMFVFALTLVNQYWGLMIANQSAQINSGFVHAGTLDQTSQIPKASSKPLNSQKVLTGIKARLDLKGDVEKQITDMWAGLYAKEIYLKMPKGTDTKVVYMAYYNYSFEAQTIDVLLGYAADVDEDDGSGLIKKVIDSKDHEAVEGKTVLEVWLKPEKRKLAYDEDFDIYYLDDNWNVKRTVSMVGILEF